MTGYRIGIDTGGTFTDGLIADRNGNFSFVKTLTTPYDLGECFRDVLSELAKRKDKTLDDLLREADYLVYSTTHGTNTLLERSGPRLGLIVSAGMADRIKGDEFIVPPGMIKEVIEDVSDDGEMVQAVSEEEIRACGEELNDAGARAIVVAFRNASLNRINEDRAKAILEVLNPDHSFGWVPVFSSSDLSLQSDDIQRVVTAVVNAFIHSPLARFLYPLERELRTRHVRRPLLLAHGTGGVARVAKSTALRTFQSGPASGAIASTLLADAYGWKDVLCVDMGGTSTDVTLILDGRCEIRSQYPFGKWRLDVPVVDVHSMASGGSSIVTVEDGRVMVGPNSAGARPGPACFDLGGEATTVTDADLVLDVFDLEYFRGGQVKLSRELAVEAIEKQVAGPLGVGVEEAAAGIVDQLESQVAQTIEAVIRDTDRDASDFVLFSYGGAGPTHSCGYAARVGISRIVVFPFASVLSAFGCVNSDIAHHYPVSLSPSAEASNVTIADRIRDIQSVSIEDMRTEGFDPSEITFRYWLEVEGASDGAGVWLPLGASTVEEVADELREYASARAVIVEALISVPKLKFEAGNGDEPSVVPAKGKRDVYIAGARRAAAIHDASSLRPGSRVKGPAIIESEFTSCTLPPNAELTVDPLGTALIELR